MPYELKLQRTNVHVYILSYLWCACRQLFQTIFSLFFCYTFRLLPKLEQSSDNSLSKTIEAIHLEHPDHKIDIEDIKALVQVSYFAHGLWVIMEGYIKVIFVRKKLQYLWIFNSLIFVEQFDYQSWYINNIWNLLINRSKGEISHLEPLFCPT